MFSEKERVDGREKPGPDERVKTIAKAFT